MKTTADYRYVLAAYPQSCQPMRIADVESLGDAGGFSGACFWRWESPRGPYCLRRWPAEHPSSERLTFIHGVLAHVDASGFHRVPVPIESVAQGTFVSWGGHLWELTRWLPGEADYRRQPTREKLAAALAALARFHLASSTYALAGTAQAPSTALADRLRMLSELEAGGRRRLADCVTRADWPELARRADRLLNLFTGLSHSTRQLLERVIDRVVVQQPCIRDVWHDHVLFRGNDVVGLVDFGAMKIDNVACDVARLLGSLAGNDAAAWQVGLDAYQAVRPLSPDERILVPALDRSNALLSGINWLQWIYVQQRRFARRETIISRIDDFLRRLDAIAEGQYPLDTMGYPVSS